jgi:hypothetical protein
MNVAEHIAGIDNLLTEIGGPRNAKQDVAVRQVLEHVFSLWRADAADKDMVQEFLARSAPEISKRRVEFLISGAVRLQSFINQEFVGNQWETMCLRRSHIEAFNDLYAPVLAAEDLIDTEELDEDIREKAEYEAMPVADLMPEGLPESHWWWKLE